MIWTWRHWAYMLISHPQARNFSMTKSHGEVVQKNNSKLMQISIEALAILSFVVHDAYASIGWFMTYSQNVKMTISV